MCQVCSRPLDVVTDLDGNMVDYWHASLITIGEAHDPVPVPRVEETVVGVCDFCADPGVAWRYRTRTFDAPDIDTDDMPVQRPFMNRPGILTPRSVGDWCACHACHDDIEAGQWDSIARRATRSTPKMFRRELKDHVRRLHRQFLSHRTEEDPIALRRTT